MISCENLRYVYKSSGDGLYKLNTQIEPGHIYGLLGKNGSGKTTLLRIISALLFAQEGDCNIQGLPVKKRLETVLQDLYMFPEEVHQYSITGEKFIACYAPFYPHFDREYFLTLIEELDVLYALKRSLDKLSAGQRKKFYFAFALSTNVRVLLLDEPTNALDIPSRTAVKGIIYHTAVKNDEIVIISTHNIRDIEDIVDTYILVDEGNHLFTISKEDINSRFTITLHQESSVAKAMATAKVAGGYASLFKKQKKTKKSDKCDIELFFTLLWNNIEEVKKVVADPNASA